ncbi:MAG TPA: hypothetical protein VHQ47_06990 [Phycisphaerae bacterium]|nr:hypothetical protein [Phycisphaerae bacterium]
MVRTDPNGVLTLIAPTIVSILASLACGLVLLVLTVWVAGPTLAIFIGPGPTFMFAFALCILSLAFLPAFLHARCFRFDPVNRTVTRATRICGFDTSPRLLAPFEAAGKISLVPPAHEGDTWQLEIWIGPRPFRFPQRASARKRRKTAARLAAMLHKCPQSWDRHGSWT